jgi:hypothetical protein
MQEVNWGVFSAKFDGREQVKFEWFCYLLFSVEHNLPLGMSHYENHAGIETNPIKVNEDYVGWQAKFYTTRLSEHTNDFKDAITIAKTRHPKLTKVIFYTNKSFGQDKKKTEPQYKLDIEKHAKDKGVTVEWRGASFFKSTFVTKDNSALAKYFFSFDKSIVDLVAGLHDHSTTILQTIKSEIPFDGRELKIDRTTIADRLRESLMRPQPIIVSGDGGVGKTAVIKDFFELMQPRMPLFMFKAIEFNNASSTKALFKDYGDFNVADFATAFDDVEEKSVVIDSAEKLADIEDLDVFQEFLAALLKHRWKIIFTTRRGYLDDLQNMLVGIYNISFDALDISNLTRDELDALSKNFNFDLPTDSRLVELISNPFYLNEYLQNYSTLKRDVTYSDFKSRLWDKKIARSSYKKDNTHIRRESCFLELARRRANKGSFYIKADDLDQPIIAKLLSDEIIGRDEETRGYFIAHDIYEEWALEKIIQEEFHEHSDVKDFYAGLGTSLPVRRAFRHWLTDKLLVDRDKVKALIESTIANENIPSHWRDEVIVAVLLSEHSKVFFDLFEKELLANDAELLIRVTFLLRIACKEMDIEWLRRLGITKIESMSITTLFTRPKGSGWTYVIDFVNHHKDKLEIKSLYAILGLLEDWSNKFKQGATTKNAGEIALFYYQKVADNGGFGHRTRDLGERLAKTILNTSAELKEELGGIIDEIVLKRQTHHRDKYYELAQKMLGSVLDSFEIASAMPEKLIELARVFWLKEQNQDDEYSHSSLAEMDGYFGLASHTSDYYPSSAYQTPILQLLRIAPDQTLDFILELANKTAKHYSTSSLAQNELDEVEVIFNDNTVVKQHISSRLWEIYRGTHVCSTLLESVHMALEKWLLEYGKTAPAEELESRCLYLLKNTRSASITAAVTSVTLAYPNKLFNVAMVLFRTRKFFLYDTTRLTKDRGHKSSLEMLHTNYPNSKNWLYDDERIKTCDDPHRTKRLEDVAVEYQFIKFENESDEDFEKRQKVIWDIFDIHYAQLPNKSKETDRDRTWRLYLSRMDRRKMHPTTEQKDGQTLIHFNPEIDPELKKYSEDSLRESEEAFRHTQLNAWARYRWEGNEEKYKSYQEYEDSQQVVIEEVRQIIEERNAGKAQFDAEVPSYACAVLVRDFADKLSSEDKQFCKEVVFSYAGLYLQDNSSPHIGDGVEQAIDVLPLFFGEKKEDDEIIKSLLLILLMNDTTVGMGQYVCDYAMRATLHRMWKASFEDANSIFLGYLLLRPKYEALREEIRKENLEKRIYHETSYHQIIDALSEKYETETDDIIANKVGYSEVPSLKGIPFHILVMAFNLLPYKTDDADHKKFLSDVLALFSKKLSEDRTPGDHETGRRLLEKFANFVLASKQEDISTYLEPFLDGFTSSDNMADLFQEFVSVEDRIHHYEEFWIAWELFYPAIVKVCHEQRDRHDTKTIIHNYLLAWPYWKKDARKWASLKDRERGFFKKVAEDIGDHPAVLYSLTKLLNEIGSGFIDDGVLWISDILEKNHNYETEDLEVNTIYYLENIIRRFVLANRHRVKTTPTLKKRVLTILDFLIQRGSVVAYLTREDIL